MQASEINYELSIRIGDPVPINNPDEDGEVFTGIQRMKYISRAYAKLSRMLRILMRDYQPDFNKVRAAKYSTMSKDKNEFILTGNLKIEEVYVSYVYSKNKTKTVQAVYMEPSKFLSNKYDPNDIKSNSFVDGKIKYTVMVNSNGVKTIQLLPQVDADNYYTSIEYLEASDYRIKNWNDEIPITNDYIDLLIDLAAIQAMQDIARVDKAQLIEKSIQTDWQILGQYGTYMKQTEGVKE